MKAQQPWHIGVLIPACNEEELLPRCLDSVLIARARVCRASWVTCDIIVAVDASTDGTGAIAQTLPSEFAAVIDTDAGNVGHARALAAEAALLRYTGPRERCWLANTDADCIVPPHWLEQQLEVAELHIQAIAGIIDVDTFAEHSPQVEERFRATYCLRPDGSHPHIHGANLGVRADAYLRAGGWSKLATAEDHDLWRRIADAGCPRVSTVRIRVSTSGRRVGRAPMGFANALALHNETAA